MKNLALLLALLGLCVPPSLHAHPGQESLYAWRSSSGRRVSSSFQTPKWDFFEALPGDQPAQAWAVIIAWELQDVAIQSLFDSNERRLFEFEGQALQYAVSNTLKYYPRGSVAVRLVDRAENRSVVFKPNDGLDEVSNVLFHLCCKV